MSYRVGTGPAYKTGEVLNGTTDYNVILDTPALEPSLFPEGSFSVGCRFVPADIANANRGLATKYLAAGDQQSWYLSKTSTATCNFTTTNIGTGVGAVSTQVIGSMAAGGLTSCMGTYKQGVTGASTQNTYANYPGLAVATSAIAQSPVFNSTANIEFGAYDAAANFWSGQILECDMYKKDLSAIEVNKWMNPYYTANNNGQGFYVYACSGGEYAQCSPEKCRSGSSNICSPQGKISSLPFTSLHDAIIRNNYFSAYTGDISNPTITNWVKAVTGAGSVTLYAGDSAYGSYSARLKGGSADSSSITSDCMALTGAGFYVQTSAKVKSILERKLGRIKLTTYRYSDAACATPTTNVSSSYYNPDSGQAWSNIWFYSREAGSQSIKTQIIAEGNGVGVYDYLVSLVGTLDTNIEARSKSYKIPTPSITAPTAITGKTLDLFNPLSSYFDSMGALGFTNGYCFGTWIYTDWVGDDSYGHRLVFTSGYPNLIELYKDSSNYFGFTVTDAGGGLRRSRYLVDSTTWPAGWKYAEFCSPNIGDVKARYYLPSTSTWYTGVASSVGGTGILSSISVQIRIGDSGLADTWYFNLVVGKYSAIWPMLGFYPIPQQEIPY
jgi:hypothetical protein